MNLKFTIDIEEQIEQALGKPIEELSTELSNRGNLRVVAKFGLQGAGMTEVTSEKNAGKVTRKDVLEALYRDFGISVVNQNKTDEVSK